VEHIGIRKTFEKMEAARVIIYMVDGSRAHPDLLASWSAEIQSIRERHPDKPVILLVNKTDRLDDKARKQLEEALPEALGISARTGEGLEQLQASLLGLVNRGVLENNDPVVSNSRHYQALVKAQEAIGNVREGMEAGIPSDLVSVDINEALHHLGEITGQISTDDLLGNIFSNFCIGK